MYLLRKILFPFVPVYYAILWLRNKLYDWGVFKSTSFDLPIISVGNLSVGGTGKSPMIEYLIRLLQSDHKLATLSRGYKRSTKGFQIADESCSALTLGDEPFQFYKKFDDVQVAVDADRVNGINQLLRQETSPDVILLDDAHQHRKVLSGQYILLTAYDKLYANDWMLPTGNLREPRAGAKRANLIVVTKCPENISGEERLEIIKKLKPKPFQKVFFSSIAYGKNIVSKEGEMGLGELNKKKFTLITGIADPKHLVSYLKEQKLDFDHMQFSDHHDFSATELQEINKKSSKGPLLTTEKDFVRLADKVGKNLFYLPIQHKFLVDGSVFDSEIKGFIKQF